MTQHRKRKERRFKPGMKVLIVDQASGTETTAIYEGRFDTRTNHRFRGPRANGIPRLRLEDGGVAWGCDCWWIPLDEANEVKSKLGIK
jgi:hypothetical protein